MPLPHTIQDHFYPDPKIDLFSIKNPRHGGICLNARTSRGTHRIMKGNQGYGTTPISAGRQFWNISRAGIYVQ
jgi:hypothetical protein